MTYFDKSGWLLAFTALLLTGCGPPADGPREGYLVGDGGIKLYYQIEGKGLDTVVVVHGGPGAGMNALLPDFGPLHAQRVVIYFDQRGGGRSELPTDTSLLNANAFIGDLESVRTYFGLERMDVLAHSFGSILVAEYSRRHPDHLGRVVFLGATGPKRSDAGASAQSQYAGADTTLLRRMFEPMSALMRGSADDPVATCRQYREAGRALAQAQGHSTGGRGSECDMPPDALTYYFKYTAQLGPQSFGDWDYTASLTGIDSPVLVIYGDRDSAAVAMQRDWAKAFAEGRLLLVPDAGKGVHISRPDLVFPAIDVFLDGRWPESSVPG